VRAEEHNLAKKSSVAMPAHGIAPRRTVEKTMLKVNLSLPGTEVVNQPLPNAFAWVTTRRVYTQPVMPAKVPLDFQLESMVLPND
jgi:hypothetical protein